MRVTVDRMKLVLASLLLVPAIAGADVMVSDNDQTVTVDCAKDKNVHVSGNKATVTLTGVCDKVLLDGNEISLTGSAVTVGIRGNDNTATLEAVDGILTPGNKNKVTWKKGVKKAKPKISNAGNGNKIAKVK